MPVRGRGWYKRPYKIKVTYDRSQMIDKSGPKEQTYSFHWPGARDAMADQLSRFSHITKVEVWDEPVDSVQVRT